MNYNLAATTAFIMKIKRKSIYSYSPGVFPTLELLKSSSAGLLKRVLVGSKSSENRGVSRIIDLCRQKKIRIEENDRLLQKISGKDNCYAAGEFLRFQKKVVSEENHLVLVGIRDMGNLGTICRTMLGFGFNNLVIIKPAADLLNPKTIRSSMGAVFHLNFEYFNDFDSYVLEHKNNLYPFSKNGKKRLDQCVFIKPYSLIFGSEASGLQDDICRLGTGVYLKQNRKIDSLNLAVAAAIAMYHCIQI